MTITPYLLYEDVAAAMEFLARAFGFEEVLRYADPQGDVNHAEMRLGDDVNLPRRSRRRVPQPG